MDEVSHTETQSQTSPAEGGGVAGPRWLTGQRKLVVAIVAGLALAAALPPWLNIGRFKRKIAASISGSIGRPVHMDRVGLRLLPAPAFTLENFVVGEDAAFGAEPVLRSPSVTAVLHISSLWRGRLEFASISLDEASVNLVRDPAGRWNAEGILLQAAHVATAPTAQRRAGSLPRFPYIQAENARVNIKMGDEKLPLSFMDAKFALWLSGPGHWQARIEARPVRTDMNLTDTGTIRIEGELGSASNRAGIPLNLRLEWKGSQLGEATRLLTGRDEGWRGSLAIASRIQGTVGDAHLSMSTALTGLRREEFFPNNELDLALECAAQELGNFASLSDLHCALPISGGKIELKGSVDGLKTHPQAAVELRIHQIPAQSILAILRHANNRIVPGLTAEGMLEGAFRYGFVAGEIGKPLGADSLSRSQTGEFPSARIRSYGTASGSGIESGSLASRKRPLRKRIGAVDMSPRWMGEAILPELVLRAPDLNQPLVVENLRFAAGISDRRVLPGSVANGKGQRQQPGIRTPSQSMPLDPQPAEILALLPVELPLGAALPASLTGSFGPAGYRFQASGGATLARLLDLNAAFHLLQGALRGLQPAGTADLNISVDGSWEAASQPETLATPASPARPPRSFALRGSLQLKGARLTTLASEIGSNRSGSSASTRPLPDARDMISLATAHLLFEPDSVTWSGIVASYSGIRVEGIVRRPIGCSAAPETQDRTRNGAQDGAAGVGAGGTSNEGSNKCAAEFDLSAGAMSLGSVEALSAAAPAKKSLLDFFSRPQPVAPAWPAAHGALRIAALTIGPVVLSDALIEMSFEGNRANIQALTAKTLNGSVEASGALEMTPAGKKIAVDASLRGVQLSAAAALFHEQWGEASGNAHCALHLEGASKAKLRQSAQGTCDWALRNGALNIVPRSAASPNSIGPGEDGAIAAAANNIDISSPAMIEAAFQQWRGEAAVADGRINIADSQVKGSRGSMNVSGTVSFDRSVDLHWGAMRLDGRLQAGPSAARPAASAGASGAASPDVPLSETGKKGAKP